MMPAYDESYVPEILTSARSMKVISKDAFDAMTTIDRNAGYAAEVAEAFKRLTAAGVIQLPAVDGAGFQNKKSGPGS